MRQHLGRVGYAAALAAVAWGLPQVAHAQPSPARLQVSGASEENGCADDQRLAAAVERRLGRSVFDARAALEVRVSFARRTPRGWLARIALFDGTGRRIGERELVTNAVRCHDLDSSLALVTALLVDSPPPEPAAAPPKPEVTDQRPPRKPTRLLVTEELEEPRQAEPWRFMVGASAVAVWGRVPGLLAGARFDLDLKPPHFTWLRLEAGVYLPRSVEDAGTGAAAEVRQLSAAAAACPWLTDGSPAFWMCLGQQLDWTQARGLRFDVNREHSRIGLSLFARAGVSARLFGPLWLRVGLTAGVPVVRDRFIFSGSDRQMHELFRTQPVLATGELGFAAALP